MLLQSSLSAVFQLLSIWALFHINFLQNPGRETSLPVTLCLYTLFVTVSLGTFSSSAIVFLICVWRWVRLWSLCFTLLIIPGLSHISNTQSNLTINKLPVQSREWCVLSQARLMQSAKPRISCIGVLQTPDFQMPALMGESILSQKMLRLTLKVANNTIKGLNDNSQWN